jgi:diguanylate cyclase (GGDEF)-like protein
MAVPAEKSWRSDERGQGRAFPAATAAVTEEQPAMLEWALAAAAAAEARIADLEQRLAFLEGLLVTDELTGVLNRRGLVNELARAISAAARGGPRGVLIVCDLDGFKAINDCHGHRAGNELLRQVAATLRRRVRENDVVGRLGGDEFALLLIGATLPNARRKCMQLGRTLVGSPPSVEGLPIPLDISFGLAAYDGSEDQEALLHRADMAMYDEKRRRNGGAVISA